MIIINLRGVSTKLYFNFKITMPTYKEFITKQNLYYDAYFKNNLDLGFEYSLACHPHEKNFEKNSGKNFGKKFGKKL